MKRDLFSELSESFEALNERNLKITLKQHPIEKISAPVVTRVDLIKLRQKLNVSQAVMAQILRTNKRTLENWEQGRSKPNAQAAVLIKMVDKYPDTFERLGTV